MWGEVFLSRAERREMQSEWPEWDGEGRPPIYDWYVALRLAEELRVDIFSLEGLDIAHPIIREAVKSWALIKIQADNLVSQMQADARERRSTPPPGAG